MVTIIDNFTFTLGTIFVGLLLVIAIHSLTTPRSALLGLYGAIIASVLAIAWFSILFLTGLGWVFAFVPLLFGALIGFFLARVVRMTSLPQLVALLNGLGGLAAILLGLSTFFEPDIFDTTALLLAVFLPVWIGAVTFAGSLVAVAKLYGKPKIFARDYQSISRTVLFGLIFLGLIVLLVLFLTTSPGATFGWVLLMAIIALSLIQGVVFVVGIGSADMPIAVSTLNALSGAAGTTAGFLLRNDLLVIIGAIVLGKWSNIVFSNGEGNE
ncbi:hypothetical protein GEMRC1_002503 [Eukaryota sp. GEM-RC1]